MFDAAIAAAAEAEPQAPIVTPLVPGLQLHVDGDYLAYYASGNEDTTAGEARMNALGLIERFRARVGAETVIMHNTARGCQKGERFLIATVKPYQGNRDSGRKPKNHAYLQEWLQSYEGQTFRAKNWTSREADDGMAACAHHAVGTPVGYAAIATADKDMRMFPGAHICWRKPAIVTRVKPGDYEVMGEDGKLYGLKWFCQQMLEGDAADNCPGLERAFISNAKGIETLQSVGPKKAEKLLEDTTCIAEGIAAVIGAYLKGYNHCRDSALDRFCEQAALMWMRLGNDAAVADFARHAGHSRINHTFTDEVWAAVKRLETRVKIARSTINSFADRADPLCADSLAA